MSQASDRERGAALAVALFALVVIGGLVGAVFPLATLELRAGDNARYGVEADEAAEAGRLAVLTGWVSYRFDTLAVNGTASLGPSLAGGRPGARWDATVIRLNNQLFLVRSVGTRLDGAGRELARREVAQVLRFGAGSAPAGAVASGAIFARSSAPAGPGPARRDQRPGTRSVAAIVVTAVAPMRYRGWARVY